MNIIFGNHKKYTDFNVLGLYRSISENDKLPLEDKIYIRDLANETFGKTFNFLQLKDPKTYFVFNYSWKDAYQS